MRVLVYVEGESDRVSMEYLLDPLIRQKRQQGLQIVFLFLRQGIQRKIC